MKSTLRLFRHAMLLGAVATPLAAQVYTPPRAEAPAPVRPVNPAERGFIGLAVEPLPEVIRQHLPMLPAGAGLLVREVQPDSPAAAAGIDSADILVRWNDQLLVHPGQFENLAGHAPGAKVNIHYLRRGAMAKVDVTLGSRPAGGPESAPPSGPLRFQQSPGGNSLRLDIDFGQLQETLRNVNPEELLKNIDVEALIRDLDLERRLQDIEGAVRDLNLEQRLNELLGALQSLNLEGVGQEGIIGLLQELMKQPQAPPPLEPGTAPEAPAPRKMPGLLEGLDPQTLRDAAEALDLQNVDPALIDDALKKLRQGTLDPKLIERAARELGIENVDPKMMEEAMKAIDPAVINGLLQSFGRKAPAPPPVEKKAEEAE